MEITNLNLSTIILTAGILIILFYAVYFSAKKQIVIEKYFKKLRNNNIYYVKYVFLFLAFFLLIPSIFGIKAPEYTPDNETEGIDIVFVLDVSKSMNVEDIVSKNYTYNRLDFAKKSISYFVQKNPQNKYSLIIFSGDAVSVTPLTNDINFFATQLDNVDYKNLTIQGSNFTKALNLAKNRLNISEDSGAAIVFISDGGDDDDFVDKAEIAKYKKDKVSYLIAGVGSIEGGKIITGRDIMLRPIYQTYNGETVISKLNEKNLEEIALGLNGNYEKLSEYSDITKFEEDMNKIEKKVIDINSATTYNDISRRLGMFSFIVFILYLFMFLFEDKIYSFIRKKHD